ncbi:putative ribonuclease H-like domain-containing protein [Tanacetum coccineum]|uniref:Ribonuclease H-like domain-containing protein n=1 Tax=Tanacetum coccineum TaxID=301880 RepID=A0ABQ5F6A9_9ASTR
MSAHDKNGLGFGTQIDELSNKSKTDSENSMIVFEVRSSDEESTLGNSRFTKATESHAVSPPITGNPLTPRADISFGGLDKYAIRNKIIESKTLETTKTLGFNRDKVIIEDWTSDDEEICVLLIIFDIVRPKASNIPIKRSYFTQPVYKPKDLKPDVKTFGVKNMTTVGTRVVVSKGKVENVFKKDKWGNPEILLQDHAVVDSGCSSYMNGNKAYLSDYEDFNRGFMAFGSDPKRDELKINLFSVSQMCDKKNSVLFTESECLILTPSFKLLDESQVVLRAPRKDDVYSLDLKNIVPSRGITCLYVDATADESKLWHRRLGHVNFKNINKLVKGHLVRGLPSKVFMNDLTCVACKKGKQHKASCKAKLDRIIRKPLELLHMDLFGLVSIESINKKRYCLVVTDDFSRFSWVFFLATKDETSEILCNLITCLEKQLNHNVKIIRCDNGTEFKNYAMNEFCAKKGIKRKFSVARTPQQNGVAERKNRTLIEAARTMLADSLLPIPFWAEAVNTACYVLNRVLVTKPQNKTPYELLIGKSPSISFMRPFGCPLTILNTLDSLGKFDGKSDEGYLLGYSTSSKAFRVYNKRTKRVEENLHINFLEDQPNVAGTGPNWMFDLDFLTNSMNYIPVSVENQVIVDAGTQDSYVAGSSGKDKGPTQEYILLPLQPHRTRIPVKDVVQDAQEQPSENASPDKGIQVSEDVFDKEGLHPMSEDEQVWQDELEMMPKLPVLTNLVLLGHLLVLIDHLLVLIGLAHPNVSAASTSTGANADESSFVYLGGKIPIDASTLPNADLPIDPNMPDLEDASDTLPNDGIFNRAYDDDEDVGAMADFNNMDNTIDVSLIPTLRIHKDHPKGQILGDPTSAVQTRGKIQKASLAQQALVWILVDLPFGKKAIGTKWVFRNKRDERSIVVKNKARLVAQGHRQEEGIDYGEVFAPVAIIEAIWLFLAFASYKGFLVNQMDVKSAFLYALRAWYETLSSFLLKNGFRRGTIDKTLFIKKNKSDIMLVQVYVDDIIFGSTKKSMCTEFEEVMHKRFQMSSMGELTFFLGLQVKQQPDGIFISQDKYVADILKKFDFCSIKTATTPIESNKPLIKDEDGVEVDVHEYRSMIGSLMYLTASRPDIMFAVCACARFQVTPKASHLHAVKRIFRYLKHQPKLGLWYPRDSPFELEAFSDSDYAGASLDRKSTTGGCQFLGRRLISWQCKKQTIVANSTTEAEYVAAAHCCGQVLWIQNQMMDYGFNFMNTKIHIDNESTICVVKNPVYHSRTKHIEIRHHFIKGLLEKQLMRCCSQRFTLTQMFADLLNHMILMLPISMDLRIDRSSPGKYNSSMVYKIRIYILLISVHQRVHMANLKYFDKHNMVAFLKKPNESVGFTEVVDFLKGTSLRYALTHNPTIYDSLVKQFWQTATVRTLANGTQQLVASIDSKEYTITEASVRSKLQLADATGIHNLSDAEIYAGLATLGYVTEGKLTFWKKNFTPQWKFLIHHILHCLSPKSGGWDQFGSTIATALICLSSNRVYNFSKMIFDGMVHNLESNSKILMYPRFLQIILDITTENKGRYLAPTLTKKLFANMKRGYAGDIVPLLPAMLAGAAVDQGEGSAQPAEPHHTPVDPISSTSQPPIPSPIPSPPHPSPPPHSPLQSPPHSPYQSPPHSPPQSSPHFSPPRSYEAPLPEGNTSGSAEDSMQLKELMVLVPTLVTRVTSLEKELKETKQTLGNVVLKLVKKVKSLEIALKKKSKKVLISESEGDVQEEEISPTILEAAKTLSKVASQGVSKEKSTDKGKRYRRRARSMAKKIDTGLDVEEEINTGREEINTGIEEVSTGSTKVDSGTASKRGQREGKAPMVEEDIQATYKTKEQVRQEEAGLEEAIKLQAQLDEEVAKQIHLDKMIAKRMAEEEALTEQQKKRKAQVQFEAQFYTEEDWDTIRAKLEANAELSKDVLGQDLPEQDFAKRMVDMVNQRKKHFAEERAKAKRNKPMTQSQLRIYMSNYLKNQGTWKLSQLKKLKFEEIKEEFDKLVHQIDTFIPINLEAIKEKLKRYGEELQTKTSKKQRFDDKDVPVIGEKVDEVKEEEHVKRTGKRKKQKARKSINPTPLTIKSDSVVNWKIFQQGRRSIYQIMRANGADTVYMSFGAMVKDFTREDLIELYRLVMQKYGTNRPEDAYDRVLWSDLKTMFYPPLIEDAIWSLSLQQKMVS